MRSFQQKKYLVIILFVVIAFCSCQDKKESRLVAALQKYIDAQVLNSKNPGKENVKITVLNVAYIDSGNYYHCNYKIRSIESAVDTILDIKGVNVSKDYNIIELNKN